MVRFELSARYRNGNRQWLRSQPGAFDIIRRLGLRSNQLTITVMELIVEELGLEAAWYARRGVIPLKPLPEEEAFILAGCSPWCDGHPIEVEIIAEQDARAYESLRRGDGRIF